MSTTGVPSIASIGPMRRRVPSIARTVDRPKWTMGVAVRWMRPQQNGGGGVFGDYVGGGTILFTGLELGFGRP
jgi:hypothetical protein